MDIQFYGANCITIAGKHARVTVDDLIADMGGKAVTKPGDVQLFTSPHQAPSPDAKLVVDQPGEYEIAGVSIYGIPARSHIDEEGKKSATMYKIIMDDINVLVLGHVHPDLSDSQLEKIGMVDILFIPVGGNGYTLDGVGALKLIKKIEPKTVIPTHYESRKLHFEVPQQSLEQALKALSMEVSEAPVTKLRIKPGDFSEGVFKLVVLEEL